MKKKNKPKEPELQVLTLPLTFKLPVQVRISKDATMKDLAKLCFMFGLQMDFDVRDRKRKPK